jgi:hypothetical protein
LHTEAAPHAKRPTSELKLHDWSDAPHDPAVLDPQWKPSNEPQ